MQVYVVYVVFPNRTKEVARIYHLKSLAEDFVKKYNVEDSDTYYELEVCPFHIQ
jgi:hypothetical protein